MTGPQVRVETIGEERQPVIVIDGFVADPEAFRAAAAAASFAERGGHYPGPRAVIPPPLVEASVGPVAELIGQTFGGGRLRLIEAFFSLITRQPSALTPIQRLPHFDGLEAGRIALLHYLGTAEQGGTAFYRHRATGFETISPERHPAYDVALRRDVAKHGVPAADYIRGDTALFARIGRFAAAPNRALIYRSRALHCADLPPGVALDPDPQRGRLTANTFLYLEG